MPKDTTKPESAAKKTGDAKKKAPAKKGGKKNAYAQYVKATLPKVKEKYPNLTHKEAFSKCAEEWKTAPENPKNQPQKA